jgi:hypothetical protein
MNPATEIPIGGHHKPGPRQLRPLTLETLDDFIKLEKPRGFIEEAYARVVATLRIPQYQHLNHLYELAIRIDTDGVQHFSQFNNVKKALEVYPKDRPDIYLRNVRVGRPDEAGEALELYKGIILPHLHSAYSNFSEKQFHTGGEQTHVARETMTNTNFLKPCYR